MRKRPRPDQIASILRDFQADLDAGLNIDQACRKAGIGPTCSAPQNSVEQLLGRATREIEISKKASTLRDAASTRYGW